MASLKRRGGTYYAQYYLGGRQKRECLHTESLQVAKEKLRNLESALARGDDCPLPTRTPIADVVTLYVQHIKTTKTARSARVDCFYLREAFGEVCDDLKRLPRRKRATGATARRKAKRPAPARVSPIEAVCFEQITTAQVAEFIGAMVRARGLAPKTANRYREVLCRVVNWAMKQGGIRMPMDRNPVAPVERYKEKAPRIRFLTLGQIEEQLRALENAPQLQTMAALYIYAGIRREEALWLTVADVDLKSPPNGMLRIRAKSVDGADWQPKTGTNRVVPISRALRAYLDRYAPRPTPGRWYFPSPEGKHYDPDNFSRGLRKVNNKAGLPWGCLDYRHTFGSQLAMKGESLYKISTLMGNSPEICRRHYAALVPEALAASVEFSESIPLSLRA